MSPSRFITPALMIAAAFLTLGQGAPAPAPATAPATAPAVEPGVLHIFLMDGSSMTGKFSINELAVETKFGLLKVPLDQVKSFTPGLHSHPEFEQKLNSCISDLSSEAFADREKAQDTLTKMGPEIKAELDRNLKTADGEKELRIQKIIEEFESQLDEDTPANAWVPDDVIVTDGFTVVGHITTSAFTVNSPYGNLNLKLSDLKQAVREGQEPDEIRKTLTVPGSLIATHGFVPSGVRLNHGDQVIITATGTIKMTPFGGNQQSGPDGGQRFGMQQPENILGGTLVARVGKGGDVFKAGSKYTTTVTKSGPLEFGIAMPSDFGGDQFPGEYTVKIRVIRKP